jgi:hypothetical protein
MTLTEDLLDRTSIALDIAGEGGLLAREVRAEVCCDSNKAYAACNALVSRGYARAVPIEGPAGARGGVRYVLVKPYPASPDKE